MNESRATCQVGGNKTEREAIEKATASAIRELNKHGYQFERMGKAEATCVAGWWVGYAEVFGS
jgi:hypothetical protein